MIKKEVRDKRNDLRVEGSLLQKEAFMHEDFEKGIAIRNKQNEVYRKWMFYDKLIKASEEVNKDVYQCNRNRTR